MCVCTPLLSAAQRAPCARWSPHPCTFCQGDKFLLCLVSVSPSKGENPGEWHTPELPLFRGPRNWYVIDSSKYIFRPSSHLYSTNRITTYYTFSSRRWVRQDQPLYSLYPSPHWTYATSSDEKVSLIQKGQVDRARPHAPIGVIFLLHLGWCSHHHREPFNSVCLTRTPLPMNIKWQNLSPQSFLGVPFFSDRMIIHTCIMMTELPSGSPLSLQHACRRVCVVGTWETAWVRSPMMEEDIRLSLKPTVQNGEAPLLFFFFF